MQFASTRDPAHAVGFSAALRAGPGAGRRPVRAGTRGRRTSRALRRRERDRCPTVAGRAALGAVLSPATRWRRAMRRDLRGGLQFPGAAACRCGATDALSVLELFHGPTAAFKDFGARFLAACMQRLQRRRGAAAEDPGRHLGRHRRRRRRGLPPPARACEVVVLFPKGLVSPTQEQQLTCWGDNVRSCRGARHLRRLPDAGQAGLRSMPALHRRLRAVVGQQHQPRPAAAAGGVLRGQQPARPAAPPASAPSLHHPQRQPRQRHRLHLGAALGPPIGDIVLAHNANRTVPDFLATGELAAAAQRSPRWPPPWTSAIPATWSACGRCIPDAGRPARRAQRAVSGRRGDPRAHRADCAALHGKVWCPHTAVAAEVYARLTADTRRGALGAGRHRASGQVPRDRRAADRPGRRCRRRWRACSSCRATRPRRRRRWTRCVPRWRRHELARRPGPALGQRRGRGSGPGRALWRLARPVALAAQARAARAWRGSTRCRSGGCRPWCCPTAMAAWSTWTTCC